MKTISETRKSKISQKLNPQLIICKIERTKAKGAKGVMASKRVFLIKYVLRQQTAIIVRIKTSPKKGVISIKQFYSKFRGVSII